MSETINTYTREKPDVCIPMKRKEFYEEQTKVYKETGKPSKYVEVINVFLFNERGQLIVQKRSSHKNHNPNLMDKSIGGHITAGDNAPFTAMVETVQELQVPSIVLNNEIDYQKTHNILKDYLKTVAILKHIKTDFIEIPKIIQKESITIGNKTHIYFGLYDGRVKTVDNEAKGILFYDLEELESELEEFPNTFTNDLKHYYKQYKDDIKEFLGNNLL